MDLGQCRCWSVCCSLVMSVVVRSWFIVDGPWTLVNIIVGQCVVRWLLRHLSFVVWFIVDGPWTLVNIVVGQCVVRWLFCHFLFVVCSWLVVGRPWTLVNVVVGQSVVRWLLSFVVCSSLLVDRGPWSTSFLVSMLLVGYYVIRHS